MYLKEKRIKLLRIKNNIFTVIAVFFLFACGSYIISEFTYYRNDPSTALHAVSMSSSIVLTILSSAMLIQAAVSRSNIGSAVFFSSYFEGDLDGYVSCGDLAEVTGKSADRIAGELRRYKRLYMKGFELKESGGIMTVELYSKKALCECRHCGAQIEKRVFFTGTCPFCGSSDLFAKVLTDERFYSISNDLKSGTNKPDYYTSRGLAAKKTIYIILASIGLLIALIGLMMTLSEIPHYFDREYQKQILLDPTKHLSSYELIKADILDMIIFAGTMVVVFAPLSLFLLWKVLSAAAAGEYAKFFAMCRIPIIKASTLPDIGTGTAASGKLKRVRGAIRRGYLLHCTLEKHGGELTAALAKQIVKDKCPSCGAPIDGAVDENYVCRYCGGLIMGVVQKKR